MNVNANGNENFCDNQPVIQNGEIQAFGFLFVLGHDFKILQVSVNAELSLGFSAKELIGKSFVDYLEVEDHRLIASALKDGDIQRLNGLELKLKTKFGSKSFPASFSMSEKHWIIELELMDERSCSSPAFLIQNQILKLSQDLKQCRSRQEMYDRVTSGLRTILQMDKVMIYGFDAHWHGLVLSEAKDEAMDSYLGLKFPDTDIPEPARRMYALNPIRMIPDIGYVAVSIEPPVNPVTGQITELTTCILRGVAPVHLEYLRNMKVVTSISVSIMQDGILWGLIALHHRTPKTIHVRVRRSLEMLSECFSLNLSLLKVEDLRYESSVIHEFQTAIVDSVMRNEDLSGLIYRESGKLSQLLNANGMAGCLDGQWFEMGEVPPRESLQLLAQWLRGKDDNQQVYYTESLTADFKGGESIKNKASGLMAISIGGKYDDFLFWFRPEEVQTVKWGGDPGQTIHFDENGNTYHPRRSFQAWMEAVHLHSKPWNAAEINIANEIRHILVDAFLAFRSARLKELTGILPICASCKKIRDEQNSWRVLEEYVQKRSKAKFSHGLCPDCYNRSLKDVGLDG